MNQRTSRLVRKAFALFGVNNFYALDRAYTREDQRLMKAGLWDAENPKLLTNQVKQILESIDPKQLKKDRDRMWRQEILWFWYHHAISYALWTVGSKALAKKYAAIAVDLQSDNGNRITRLLWFLVNDNVHAAKAWMSRCPIGADRIEHRNGLELIRDYERRRFFKPTKSVRVKASNGSA